MLVHSGAQPLKHEVTPQLSSYTTDILRRRGVELVMGSSLAAATADAAGPRRWEAHPDQDHRCTVPSAAHPLAATLNCPMRGGRIRTDETLRVEGRADVGPWATARASRTRPARLHVRRRPSTRFVRRASPPTTWWRAFAAARRRRSPTPAAGRWEPSGTTEPSPSCPEGSGCPGFRRGSSGARLPVEAAGAGSAPAGRPLLAGRPRRSAGERAARPGAGAGRRSRALRRRRGRLPAGRPRRPPLHDPRRRGRDRPAVGVRGAGAEPAGAGRLLRRDRPSGKASGAARPCAASRAWTSSRCAEATSAPSSRSFPTCAGASRG